jgi:hypothetical protein
MGREMLRSLFLLSVFAIAFAYVESAVVAYLRFLYYPEGFTFPLATMPSRQYAIEVGREAATIVMLWAAAGLRARGRWERFLHFSFAFGVWDIFYYVWLWVILRWPESLLDWDVLFLIPVPWFGPVLAPVIVSAALIGGSLCLLALEERGARLSFSWRSWAGAILGGAIVLWTFMRDWRAAIESRLPAPYPWGAFCLGMTLAILAAAIETARAIRVLRSRPFPPRSSPGPPE